MKMILASLVILAAPFAFAKSACPAGTVRDLTCTPKTQAGEDAIVGQALPKVVICSGESSVILVLTSKSGQSEAKEATVSPRVGGTTYTVSEGNVLVTVVRGVGPYSNMPRISIERTDASGPAPVSTYLCK